uniref:Uncharacterized protein n=1 Tax=Trypanosoma vivax (strain Y486) TaxID=1055687 RepID=G0TUU5_TRYVY|nr:conserved hypothetical protein [Trypanosoma vivax Y486]
MPFTPYPHPQTQTHTPKPIFFPTEFEPLLNLLLFRSVHFFFCSVLFIIPSQKPAKKSHFCPSQMSVDLPHSLPSFKLHLHTHKEITWSSACFCHFCLPAPPPNLFFPCCW